MSKRRVRFHENDDVLAQVVCVIPSLDDFTPEDHENLWFSKADYHMCRAEAKVVSRESVRLGYSKNLSDTFTEKNTVAQEQLQEWAAVSIAIRGLERWANKEHGEIRQTDQLDAVMAILEAQDEMLSCARNGRIVDAEKIRKVSTKATKTARHFARMMGKADSYVMATELGRDFPSSSSCKTSKRRIKDSSSSFADAETVSTECTTRTGSLHDSTAKLLKSPSDHFDASCDDESLSIVDGINDSHHPVRLNSRFRRFGFGKNSSNRQQGNKLDEARVSRPA
jgi:hypothetical protein